MHLVTSQTSYGRGAGVGRGRGVGSGLGVGVTLGVEVGVVVGLEVGVGVGVGPPDCAQYLPPVLMASLSSPNPPQTIISLPLQIAVCKVRASVALVVLVAIQLSVAGLYLPPVFTARNMGSA